MAKRKCPYCVLLMNARHVRQWQELRALYGQVSALQYEEHFRGLRDRHQHEHAKGVGETLEEESFIGLHEDGEFLASYHCACTICKFEWSYRDTDSPAKRLKEKDARESETG